MQRRRFVRVAGSTAAASTLSVAGCIGGIGGEDVDLTGLRISAPTPKDTALSNFMDNLADNVEAETDEISFDRFYGNELGSAPEQLEGVAGGSIDIYVYGWVTLPVIGGNYKFSAMGLPFVHSDYEQKMEDIYYDPPDLMEGLNDELEEDTGVRFIEGGGGQLGRRPPIADSQLFEPADYEGLSVRTPEGVMYSSIYNSWGGTPVQIATEELANALATGAVDVAVWPLELFFLTGVYEQKDNLHIQNQYIQDTPAWINAGLWNDLTDEQQSLLNDAAEQGSKDQTQHLIENEQGYVDQMEDAGMNIYRDEIDHQALEQTYYDYLSENHPDINGFIEDFRDAI